MARLSETSAECRLFATSPCRRLNIVSVPTGFPAKHMDVPGQQRNHFHEADQAMDSEKEME
jgi:hypothetical protein